MSRKRTGPANQPRDKRGRFRPRVTWLNAEQLDAAESLVLRLEDEQPSCLNNAWGILVHPKFWGGVHRPPPDEPSRPA